MKSNIKPKKRIITIFIIVLVLFACLFGRLVFLMIVQGEDLKKQALEQQTRDRLITARRGTIYDRNGKPLAVSASVDTVSISPVIVREGEQVEETARLLSTVLDLEYEDVMEKINKKSLYEKIKQKVEKEQADTIRAADMPGVYLDEDSKRYYPYGSFASHVIGFTGVDNQGLLGIETIYDSILKGTPGRIVAAKNADGTEMPYKYERFYDPENGANIVLTIDQTIQHFLEKHLETAVIDNKVQNGAAGIIIDVKTGEILAMANKPDFDLNDPFTLNSEAQKQRIAAITDAEQRKTEINQALLNMWRNKAVVDSYEPGSTFKIITAATALETGNLTLNDRFNCNGHKVIAGIRIGCWKTAGHGSQNFVEGIQNSCNPVFMEIGERVGHEDFYKYFKAFGFTEKTGIELNGETSGIFFSQDRFNVLELATSSFGQGFQITPLQIVSAVSAVANKGVLLKPRLVKQFLDDDGNITQTSEPTVVRQVISEETARQMCQVLENVVLDGSGRQAFIKGYHIAGKTGTSEKQPRGNGKYIASFVGFAPANDPQIACLFLMDEPQGDSHMGGVIAAPVVKLIMEDCLRYLGIEPDLSEEDIIPEVVVPQVITMSRADAVKTLQQAGLNYKIEGEGGVILDQVPKARVTVAESATIILYTEEKNSDAKIVVPKVVGLSYMEAIDKLSTAGLGFTSELVIEGEDRYTKKVAGQDPPADTMVEPGSSVALSFQ